MLISFLLMRAHTAMYEIELFSYNKHKLIFISNMDIETYSNVYRE